MTNVPNRAYGCGLWKAIVDGYESIRDAIMFKVGRGDKVHFWTNSWCGTSPLCEVFPEIYSVARLCDGFVGDHLLRTDSGKSWNLHLRRALNDWECSIISPLLEII